MLSVGSTQSNRLQLCRNVLVTLDAIKRKDPSIYDTSKKFFYSDDEGEDSEDDESSEEADASAAHGTYVDEQSDVRSAFLRAVKNAERGGVSEDDEDDDMLKLRNASTEELEKADAEYQEFLKRQRKLEKVTLCL